MKKSLKNTILTLALYYVIFCVAYTLSIYLQDALIIHGWIQNKSIAHTIITLVSRLLIWTLPVFFLVEKPFDYLKLKNNIPQGIIAGVGIGAVMCTIRALAIYFYKGTVSFDLNINQYTWWNIILLVGLSEEIVFRGFLLQKIEEISTFWVANSISTLLFIVYHVPYWMLAYNYNVIQILTHSASLLWISLFLGWILRKTQSLWSCMIVHSFNNFMSVAIK